MEEAKNIRNFVIIAHIDSGKSTLADRLLEITGTVPMRSMRAQYLDRLPLERERGITIKMAPVRMEYFLEEGGDDDHDASKSHSHRDGHGQSYILNLIDTPGHSDFSYEVSRALIAVEGAILLVDGTKGIQAQTLSNLRAAQRAGLTIIPAANKIDLLRGGNYDHDHDHDSDRDNDHDGDNDRIRKMLHSVADLLNVSPKDVFKISAKTGAGVKELLDEVVRVVPPPRSADGRGSDADCADKKNPRESSSYPRSSAMPSRALIFDSLYDDHKGIIANVRVFDGEFSAAEDMRLIASGVDFKPKEVGFFSPDLTVSKKIATGEIGYIATGLKEPAMVKIGDTIVASLATLALPGYREPAAVVFISFYPDGGTKFDDLKRAFEKLRLNDAALSFEPDSNEALGRGLKVGFLGQLHFEITSSRLVSEYNLEFLTTFPSIAYKVQIRNGADQRGSPTRINADEEKPKLIYEDLTYKVRGAVFKVYNALGPGFKESTYQNALAIELDKSGVAFVREKTLHVTYEDRNVGDYKPDFVVEDKIVIELKALPFLGRVEKKQTWSYLKGSTYRLALLVNFGSKEVQIERIVHDSIREDPRPDPRSSAIFVVKQPQDFPDKPEKVWEPLVALEILTPQNYLSAVLSLQTVFDIEIAEVKNIGDNLLIEATMPLRELIRDFDDRLKSASQGYASFTYELSGERETEVEKLEILVVDEVVPALTRIVPKKDLEREGRQTAERLKELLPQEQFSQAIQARSEGRIIARETIPAMKKELGNFGKNGGDRTRKMKLWKKQQRGKERLLSNARVEISPEVFREILKK